MTIEQAVDIIKSRLKPVDETDQFHEEYIRYAMSAIWNQQISDTIAKGDMGSLDYYTKEYKNQTATQDTDTLEYYIDLPAAIVPTINDKDIQKAVRNLNYKADRGFNFVPMTTKAYTLYSGQDVLSIASGKIFYIVRHDKIIFVAGITSANASIFTSTGIRFDLVQSLDEYDYTDNFTVPGGKYEDFLVKTVNYLMGTPPVDLKNDNA